MNGPHLKSLESPSPEDALCQFVKLGKCIFAISLSPMGNGHDPSFEQNLSTFYSKMLSAKFG